MKLQYRIVFITLCLTYSSALIAADKVVVIPLYKSSSKIPNNNSQCNSTIAGTMRWTGAVYEGCNGTKWTPLSPIPTVYSSGHEWMDRNLGASRVAKSPTDEEAYGDLYQWGRYSDGHEKRDSPETSLNDFSSNDDPKHGKFIITDHLLDWRSEPNNNLWQGSGINNPCPTGFRLPTQGEWEAEVESWEPKNSAGAFASPLKLVVAGYRYNRDGTIGNLGMAGSYWSSTVLGSYSIYLIFSDNPQLNSLPRAKGFSVRCLKD